MVCNGLYVHSFVNTDCNDIRRYAPRLARRGRCLYYDVYIMTSLTVICIISFAIVIGLLISNYLCLNRISNNHNEIIRRLCTAEKFIAKVKSDITTIISRNSKDNVTTNYNFNRLYNSIKGTNERIDNIHAEIMILKK